MSVPLLHSPVMSALPGVVHGFTTREGGVSVAPRASLHLARRDGDPPEAIVENWARVARTLGGTADQVVLLDQVHGARVLTATAPTGPLATLGAADAVVTTVPGLLLAVRTADCVPVLLAAPGGVAAVHAGWRGLVVGVLPRAVEALCAATGSATETVAAAVGPHASVDAYEVGPEVIDALVQAGLDRARVARAGPRGRDHADLGRAALDQLAAAGVARASHLGACTLSDPTFFSHRRDGPSTGRQAAVIGLIGEAG